LLFNACSSSVPKKKTATAALPKKSKVKVKDDKDGKILAVFTAKEENVQKDKDVPLQKKQKQGQDLQGTSWKVRSFSNGKGGRTHVLSRRWVLTAAFDDKGGFSGSGGCNRYLAEYQSSAADRSFSFEMIKMTTEQCYPERITAQEGSFMAALYTAVSYRIQGDRLTLEDAAGKAAVILQRQ
jgi:heat shock protein HslJ